MAAIGLHCEWAGGFPAFGSGVSLHSHTLHSKESLDFIYKIAARNPAVKTALSQGERRFRQCHGVPLDLRRGWWTPPLGPLQAFRLEASRIENLGMHAIVSLSDHDDIEAGVTLGVVEPGWNAPISTEWTVPFGATFFHLGIHNLPRQQAREIAHALGQYTADPVESLLGAILAWVSKLPGVLTVFNHPVWDEKGIGASRHEAEAIRFATKYSAFLHAFEINGLRPWDENRRAILLARRFGKPYVAGGDRHAIEANVVLNLTNARTFAEFAAEVQSGHSHVLITNQYRQSHTCRILRNIFETLAPYHDHGFGWREWIDRAFFQLPDGAVRSFRELWGDQQPAVIKMFGSFVQFAGHGPLADALKAISTRRLQSVDLRALTA